MCHLKHRPGGRRGEAELLSQSVIPRPVPTAGYVYFMHSLRSQFATLNERRNLNELLFDMFSDLRGLRN
jgi:hypothetical protein